jgi:hypothetical protein
MTKIISIEAQTFEMMMERFDSFIKKIETICEQNTDKSLNKWLDNEDVCRLLKISKRTLQTYRDNGTLPFSQLGYKMYYKPEDVEQIINQLKT